MLRNTKSLQSWTTLCNPMNCSPPGSSVHGILQARILECLLFLSSGNLPNSGIEPMSLSSPTLAGGFFTTSAIWGTSKNIHISTLHPRACMYAQTLCTIHFMLHLFVYNNQADFGKLKKIWNWTILTCSYHNTAHSNWNSKGDPSLKRRNVGLLF